MLTHPLAALTLWAAVFCGWHLPALYDAALAHEPIHAIEHATTFTAGALMWAALFEPLPGPAWFTAGWKIAYLTIVRLVQATPRQPAAVRRDPLYAHYLHIPRLWGLAASDDQNIAGEVITTSEIEHISRLAHQHIHLYGHYPFDLATRPEGTDHSEPRRRSHPRGRRKP